MKQNCRNCGAPHNEIICEYCGTRYGKPLLLPFKKLRPDVKGNVKPLVVWLIVIFCVCVGFTYVMYVKRRKNCPEY